MSSVERQYFGLASGALGTMRVVGQMSSMGLAMMVFSIKIGKAIISPDLYPQFLRSLRIVLMINGTLCFIAVFLSLARGRLRQDGTGGDTNRLKA